MLSATGELTETSLELAYRVDTLSFSSPVAYTYNPLIHAWDLHAQYLALAGSAKGRHIFMGMNPGPWGMAQTGVPFGAVPVVRGWMGLKDDKLGQPGLVHPKRPIEGFACKRVEVSGLRFWGLIQTYHERPESFFSTSLVLNYCPLVFMDRDGRNLTPDKLKKDERLALEEICSQYLLRLLQFLEPRALIAVGNYARQKFEGLGPALHTGLPWPIITMPHPSPANPKANHNWQEQAETALGLGGVEINPSR